MLSNAMCDFFLEVDNFACSRFSLKEWAVTCILQKYFPVKRKKSYIGFVCYLNFLVVFFDVNTFCIIVSYSCNEIM